MAKFLNHEKPLNRILANTNKALFKKKGFHLFKLMTDWEKIVPEIAELAEVTNLKKNQSGQTLELTAKNKALILQIEYQKEQIIKKVNGFFGEEIINQIKLS